MSKPMNILLWVLQILLAFYNAVGGIYMIGHYKILAYLWIVNALPAPAWVALGVLQVLFALGLVLPGSRLKLPKFTPISAVGLAIISLLGSMLYDAYAGSGMIWVVVPAALLTFVAYERGRSK